MEESPCELQRRGRGQEKGEAEGGEVPGEEGEGNVGEGAGEGVEVRQPKAVDRGPLHLTYMKITTRKVSAAFIQEFKS